MCTTINTSGDVFCVTTPMRCTSSGRRGKARETRFCTWICAMSGSVPCLNAMRSGNGVGDHLRVGAGVARRHLHRGRRDGGVFAQRQLPEGDGAGQQHEQGQDDGEDRPRDEEALDDDPVAALQAGIDDTQPFLHLAQLYLAVLGQVVLADDQHIILPLVRANGLIVHQDGRALAAGRQSGSGEQARRQLAIGVRDHGAGADGAGTAIDLVGDEVERACVGKPAIRGQPHGDGKRRLAATGVGPGVPDRVEVGRLVDVEVDVHGVDRHDRAPGQRARISAQ
ncbi:hypothetical protein G6F35_012508 [Rhizopus arrhizus]|nr:hypothetical protein G6F35_012508 [Rhizopus arrhizus]